MSLNPSTAKKKKKKKNKLKCGLPGVLGIVFWRLERCLSVDKKNQLEGMCVLTTKSM
jgi:hypothetical protein